MEKVQVTQLAREVRELTASLKEAKARINQQAARIQDQNSRILELEMDLEEARAKPRKVINRTRASMSGEGQTA